MLQILQMVVLLEAVRKHCPDARFIHCSTNKVYGDTPNRLPVIETEPDTVPPAVNEPRVGSLASERV